MVDRRGPYNFRVGTVYGRLDDSVLSSFAIPILAPQLPQIYRYYYVPFESNPRRYSLPSAALVDHTVQ